MLMPATRVYQDLVEHLVTTARDTLPSEKLGAINAFLGQYYHRVPSDDLAEASPQAVCASTYSGGAGNISPPPEMS